MGLLCSQRHPAAKACLQAAQNYASRMLPIHCLLQRTALKRGREYDKSAAAAAAGAGPGSFQDYSRRAFYKEFVKVRRCTSRCLAGPPGWRLHGFLFLICLRHLPRLAGDCNGGFACWRVGTQHRCALPSRVILPQRYNQSLPCWVSQVVEASDVIIEVLDARDPLGCRCADVERFVRRTDPSKKIILLLNKIGGWCRL